MRQPTRLLALAASVALIATGQAYAKQCRDAAGHYVTCPAEKTMAAGKCRDAKGAFVKCTTGAGATAMTTMSKATRSARTKTTGTMAAASAPAAGKNTSATAPAGAVTAKCKDGTMSHSQHRSGTCAGHGGVASWM